MDLWEHDLVSTGILSDISRIGNCFRRSFLSPRSPTIVIILLIQGVAIILIRKLV
jgi:hypothetical protein